MKYTISILALLLIITNIFWVYSTLDNSLAADHSRLTQAHSNKTIETLLFISNSFSLGLDYKSVSRTIPSKFGSSLIKEKDNAIFINSVVLIFDDGLLSEVKLLNDLSSEEYDKLER